MRVIATNPLQQQGSELCTRGVERSSGSAAACETLVRLVTLSDGRAVIAGMIDSGISIDRIEGRTWVRIV